MKAFLKNARHSPRKMRLVADLIKGKRVDSALDVLSVAPKRAALPLRKLLESAVANARNQGIPTENLAIRECRVDQGFAFKRMMPGARGTAFPVKKYTSHVILTLVQKEKSKREIRNLKKAENKNLTKR